MEEAGRGCALWQRLQLRLSPLCWSAGADGHCRLTAVGFLVATRSQDEIFRKECRYMLSEREFTAATVQQLLHLRDACELDTEETVTALEESAKRIHKKYGNVMFRPSGMTDSGVAKKATACALFSKLLYLFESPELMGDMSEAATEWLKNIFGAVDEDCDRLRIDSLTSQADLEALDRLMKGIFPPEAAPELSEPEAAPSEAEGEQPPPPAAPPAAA